MGVLDQITQMKSQRIPDEEIIRRLQEQGFTPRAINDAISQSSIKSAVSDISIGDEMQPSITNQEEQNSADYAPQPLTQERYSPPAQYSQEYAQPPQEYSQTQEYLPQEGYGYPGGTATNTDTMIEVSEQVFLEKIKKIQGQIDDLSEFKNLAQTKIDTMLERLKRVETTIDKLQLAILDKVGSYGKDLDSIKKEMSMMQDSFGKVVGIAAERASHIQAHSKRKISKKR